MQFSESSTPYIPCLHDMHKSTIILYRNLLSGSVPVWTTKWSSLRAIFKMSDLSRARREWTAWHADTLLWTNMFSRHMLVFFMIYSVLYLLSRFADLLSCFSLWVCKCVNFWKGWFRTFISIYFRWFFNIDLLVSNLWNEGWSPQEVYSLLRWVQLCIAVS
jgi:hypothetical protein